MSQTTLVRLKHAAQRFLRQNHDLGDLAQAADMSHARVALIFSGTSDLFITPAEVDALDTALGISHEDGGLYFSSWGEKFTYFCTLNNLSTTDVAAYLGFNRSTLIRWASDRYHPSREDAVAVETFLNVPECYRTFPVVSDGLCSEFDTKDTESAASERYDPERTSSLFYAFAQDMERYREASAPQVDALRAAILPSDAGYVASFLLALFGDEQGQGLERLERFCRLNLAHFSKITTDDLEERL